MRIPVAGPSVTEKEISYVADAAANAWYSNADKYNKAFETAFAAYVGSKWAVSLPHCTAGLHLSLAALGIGPGDEVIVPDATWIASAAPISYVGATPVFADIDPITWCIDVESVHRNITPRTKAVIAVDLYGSMPDMDGLRALLGVHGIPMIEDAAEAIGSEYKDAKAGSFGLTGVFSFHGSKTLTTGEGGMLVTSDKAVYDRVVILRDHGRHPGDKMFFNHEIGFKYKMSSMQAAFGLAQLERIDELIARKREIFSWYAERLHGLNGVTLNNEPAESRNSYWMVTVVLDPAFNLKKEVVIAWLDRHNIDSRPFFHPLTGIPAYGNHPMSADASTLNPVAYAITPFGVNLPSGYSLTRADVNRVCDVLLALLENPAESVLTAELLSSP